MTEDQTQPTAPQRSARPLEWMQAAREYLFAHDVGDAGSLVFITLATVVTALLSVQLHTFNSSATRMRDRAMQYALQAMGSRSRGELQSAYGWTDAYRLWLDWNGRANLADERGDGSAAERYRLVRDRAVALAPLLGPKYFDPARQQAPNLRAYESDTYVVESTALGEMYARTMDMCIRLMDKTQATTLQLVLLGVAIALVALTPKKALQHPLLRAVPLAAATLLFIGVVAWALKVQINGLPNYSDAAVQRYAEGVGLQHQKRDAEARTAFDAALAIEPGYAEVYYRRGIAQMALGKSDEAARDFQSAWDSGRRDVNVMWNLGWAQYVSGQFAYSVQSSQRGLTLSPGTPALLFNLGAAQLAAGDVQAARASYAEGLRNVQTLLQNTTADANPPTSLWADLDTASHDLDALVKCVTGDGCGAGVPPRQMISGGELVKSTAIDLRRIVKEAGVSLEYSRALPQEKVAGSIAPLSFGSGVVDATGQVSGFVALGDEQSPYRSGLVQQSGSQQVTDAAVNIAGASDAPVLVRFEHREIRPGAQFVMKVNYNGAEAPWLRIVEGWKSGPDGERLLPLAPSREFTLAPGVYVVEMYVDGRLMQEGTFTLAVK